MLSPSLSVQRWTRGAATLALSLCATFAHADTQQVKHARGTTAVASPPAKVISMDVASLDTLNALGVNVAGVPVAKFPPRLSRYETDQVLRTGTLFEPNYEVIHAAKPDLVIVGGRSAEKYPDVARIAPTIDLTVDQKDLVGSVLRNTDTLARLFHKEAEGAALSRQLQEAIAGLKQRAAGAGTGLIVLTTGGKMSAYGPGSRFGVIHDAYGFPPAVRDLNTANHGQAISFEFIAKTNPDWLLVIDRDAAIGREGVAANKYLDNELVRRTTAWQKKQVIYLDGANWYLLGNASVPAMLSNIKQIADALDAAK
ncbi:Iron compound ABC uptake transporter substrate-binding protein PiuA [plant metagenome]